VTPHFMRNGFISCSLQSTKHNDEKCVAVLQELIKIPEDILEVMVANKALIEYRSQGIKTISNKHHYITITYNENVQQGAKSYNYYKGQVSKQCGTITDHKMKANEVDR